jgi:hypothetical protein
VGKDLMAYVGCVAGAVAIASYVEDLRAAGFAGVQVVDTKRDLNAYSLVGDQSGCCPPPADTSSAGSNAVASGCCAPAAAASDLHGGLAEWRRKVDVNEYAASVRVYAVKE